MAPNKLYTWREFINSKTPFGRALVFATPYLCIAAFLYYNKCLVPSMIPQSTAPHKGAEGVSLVAGATADPTSTSASAESNSNAAPIISTKRSTLFGRAVEPIYGAVYVAPSTAKKGSNDSNEQPPVVVTGYRFV